MRKLSTDEVARLSSTYLSGGYRKDDIQLREVEVGSEGVRGVCDIVDYAPALDGSFHLSVPLAFLVIAQLAVVYAHCDHGLAEKTSEVFLRDIMIRCWEPIQLTDGIEFDLSVVYRRRGPAVTTYSGAISISGGRFSGLGSFMFPHVQAN